MAKYRKKPIVIEARQFEGGAANASPILDWIFSTGTRSATWHEAHDAQTFADGKGYPARPEGIEITTLEGVMRADVGDWIIRGVQGEFYPCKPDIFTATYDAEEQS